MFFSKTAIHREMTLFKSVHWQPKYGDIKRLHFNMAACVLLAPPRPKRLTNMVNHRVVKTTEKEDPGLARFTNSQEPWKVRYWCLRLISII